MDLGQLLFRPTPSLCRTPRSNLYPCGASTPPGGGAHGMAGYHPAMTAPAEGAIASKAVFYRCVEMTRIT